MMDIIVVALVVLVVLGAGGALTEVGDWYRDLRKPSWNPPNWLFGPAWTLILGLAGWSVVLAWRHAPDAAAHTIVIVLFSLNAVFHFLWSPLFFKLKRPDWALFEVPFLWLSILAPMIAVAPFSPLSSWLLLPYLLWVAFAAFLNLVIVRLNAPFGRAAATSAASAP
jgi:tryptophan-rich sensory protein